MRTFIIPMVGQSKRFLDAGFTLPKYMLYLDKSSLFNRSISSFKEYFGSSMFIFIARDIFETKKFIENECKLLNLTNYKIIILDFVTKGQAESTYLALQHAEIRNTSEVFIFNIDSFYKKYRIIIDCCDGYLDVFNGLGDHWSFASLISEDSNVVKETIEKQRISNNCSTGLYYFKTAELFIKAYLNMYGCSVNSDMEHYIAPMYNYLIKYNYKVLVNKVKAEDICFCGTPDEFKQTLQNVINEK